MHLSLAIFSLLSLLSLLITHATTTSSPPLYTQTVYHQSHQSPTPLPLATITYHPSNTSLSRLTSFTPPKNNNEEPTIRIAVPVAGERWRNTLADAESLSKKEGRFRVVVDRDGEVVGASWKGAVAAAGGKGGVMKGEGEFDLVVQEEGPRAVLEAGRGEGKGRKGGGKNSEEDEEAEGEVVEKTFLQKYWWLLAAVAFLAISGGGGEERK